VKLTGLTPILNLSDVQGSLAWFGALGWERVFVWGEDGFGATEPDFASVGSGEQEIFLCLDEQGSRPVWMSWFLADHAALDAAYARARSRLRDRAGADGRAVGHARVPSAPPGRAHVPQRLRERLDLGTVDDLAVHHGEQNR
jgi:hypothetical protein